MKALRFERKTDFSFHVCHLSKDTFCIIFKMELQLDDSLANRLNTFLKVTGNYEDSQRLRGFHLSSSPQKSTKNLKQTTAKWILI